MAHKKNLLQVFEHQTIRVGEDDRFTLAHFKALESYGYKTREQYFRIGNKRIKFSNYVGVLQINNLTVEVLPKIDKITSVQEVKDKWHNVLISILHECKLLKLHHLNNAKLKLKSASILDLYYDVFLTETEAILKQGLKKSYRQQSENIKKVKGKILFTNHIRENLLRKDMFYINHKIFDADNLLNQIIKRALIILNNLVSSARHQIRINKLLLALENVRDVQITEGSFDQLIFDRNTERYRSALNLAKLIILKYSPDLKSGKSQVLAILFDMNALFEEYIYRQLKRFALNHSNPITSVKIQNRLPFWERRGIKADILVEAKGRRIVIDTKWKLLEDTTPSDNDLKQMFVYNLHYQSDLSILLYPYTTVQSADKKPFRSQSFNNYYCKVAFVDIFDGNNKLNRNLGYSMYQNLISDELVHDEIVN